MSILDLFRLEQQVALVTGVGRGIGQAMTMALAEAGADVAGVYNTRYEETQARVEALGRRFLPVPCNLQTASVDQLNGVVDRVVAEMGRLDILVNNAGIIRRSPALEYPEQDWHDVLQVNLNSIFFLSQAAARVMAPEQRGKIIQVASILAFQGGITVPAYTAAKHALTGMTRALANEWAPLGINVNAIAPGYMITDATAPLQNDPDRSASLLARIPAGRWGDPADLKGITLLLASPAADYMHGSVVVVDGGWLSR